ncbi:MAG: hypothetical protein IPK96_08920 [Flammeovirgaceae bacterium]|nr:hypothetical protein [Flammeovirgaceae bacterium]
MKGLTNVSVQARMKQLLVLIALVLIGILFTLTVKASEEVDSKIKLENK